MQILLAETPGDIERCFPVMHELRPHLDAEQFLQRVERQREAGYQLCFVADGDQVNAVAGFRTFESLAWGRVLYVDDLVTTETARSSGYGTALFDWLVDYARINDCDEFHLDSGVQRFGAHRFYLNRGMAISSHHFSLGLR
jgi:GNAT superfamily N-acetyltransferase